MLGEGKYQCLINVFLIFEVFLIVYNLLFRTVFCNTVCFNSCRLDQAVVLWENVAGAMRGSVWKGNYSARLAREWRSCSFSGSVTLTSAKSSSQVGDIV